MGNKMIENSEELKMAAYLKERQKIFFKEGASKKLSAACSVFSSFLAVVIFLWASAMLSTSFIMVITPLESQSGLQKLSDTLMGDYLYVVIILLFSAIKFTNVILDKRGLLSEEEDACIRMIELVEKSKEARVYRDGVVSLGLPLLAYDLEKVKEIISEIEKKEAENKQKMLCQKAHGLISD